MTKNFVHPKSYSIPFKYNIKLMLIGYIDIIWFFHWFVRGTGVIQSLILRDDSNLLNLIRFLTFGRMQRQTHQDVPFQFFQRIAVSWPQSPEIIYYTFIDMFLTFSRLIRQNRLNKNFHFTYICPVVFAGNHVLLSWTENQRITPLGDVAKTLLIQHNCFTNVFSGQLLNNLLQRWLH